MRLTKQDKLFLSSKGYSRQNVWVEIRPTAGIFTKRDKRAMGLSWIESAEKAVIPCKDETEALSEICKWSRMRIGKSYRCTILTDEQFSRTGYNPEKISAGVGNSFVIGGTGRFYTVLRESGNSPAYVCRELFTDMESAREYALRLEKESRQSDGHARTRCRWVSDYGGVPALLAGDVVYSLHEVFSSQQL